MAYNNSNSNNSSGWIPNGSSKAVATLPLAAATWARRLARGAGLSGLRPGTKPRRTTAQAVQVSRADPTDQQSDQRSRGTGGRRSRENAAPGYLCFCRDRAREADEEASKLREERTRVRSRLGLLRRYQSALPTIELLQRARQRLEPVLDAPVLAADFEKKLDDVRKKREIDESRIRELAGEQTRIENLIRAEPPQEAVLANEGEIDELKRLVGADAKLQSESIRADTRRSEEEGKARDIFRELTGTTAWDQMTVLRLRLEDERRITELANERAAVLQDVTNCAEAVRRANEDLRIAVAKQVGAAAPTDPAPWLAAVESISALGLVETQAQVRKSEAAAEEVRLRGDFARFQPPVPCVWTEAVSARFPCPKR